MLKFEHVLSNKLNLFLSDRQAETSCLLDLSMLSNGSQTYLVQWFQLAFCPSDSSFCSAFRAAYRKFPLGIGLHHFEERDFSSIYSSSAILRCWSSMVACFSSFNLSFCKIVFLFCSSSRVCLAMVSLFSLRMSSDTLTSYSRSA